MGKYLEVGIDQTLGAGEITGSGTANYVAKFSASTVITNSLFYDNGVSVALGTASPSASAFLDITSTTQGFLSPRMTTAQRDLISSPATGLWIYNTSTSFFNYWDGATWIQVDTSTGGDVSGSGTTYKIPMWTDGPNSVLGNSIITQSSDSLSLTFGTASASNVYNFNVGTSSAYISLQGQVGTLANWAIYGNVVTPSASNYALSGTTVATNLNAVTTFNLQIGTTNIISSNVFATTFTPFASSSGATPQWTFTVPASTGQTTTVNSPNFKITGNIKTWATGALTTQYFNYFSANTVAFVGASTATNVYGLFVEASTAGANATITNNWALGSNGSTNLGTAGASNIHNFHVGSTTGSINFQGLVGSTSFSAIYMAGVTPSSSNWVMVSGGTNFSLNAPVAGGYVGIGVAGNERMTVSNTAINMLMPIYGNVSGSLVFTNNTISSGAGVAFTFTQVANTGQTASTEIAGFKFTGASRQWATGAITTQRETYFSTTTYTAVGASVITNAYGAYFEAPTASTNITITNNYAAGFNSTIEVPSIVGGSTANLNLTFKNTTGAQSSTGTCYTFYAGDNSTLISLGYKSFTFSPKGGSTGSSSPIVFSIDNSTTQTASTEIPGFLSNSYSRQWSTGAITTQREIYFKTTTYTAVGASTITNAYGAYFEKPTASTNITITNNFGLGTNGAFITSIASSGATYTNVGAGTTAIFESNTTNYVALLQPDANVGGIIFGSVSDPYFGALIRWGYTQASMDVGTASTGHSLNLLAGNANTVANFATGNMSLTPVASTIGTTTTFLFTKPAHGGATAGSEVNGFKYSASTMAFSSGGGTTATQREFYIASATYTAVTNPMTITNAYGLYVEAPTASTNITITNNYALGLAGNLYIGTFNLVTDTTTGTIIFSTSAQKGSFWGASPMVQPNLTGVTTSGFTANASANTVYAESTFTGGTGSTAYTVSDIIKNLKTAGILAS